MEDVWPYDTCGNDRSDLRLFRCLEKGIFGLSIIVLNKHPFALALAIPTQGASEWSQWCFGVSARMTYENWTQSERDAQWYDNPFCHKYNIIPNDPGYTAYDTLIPTASTPGINGDVNGVAGYEHQGKYYAAVSSKNGYFWIIDLDAMELRVSKRVTGWSNEGGASPFSLAVDNQHMIAVYTARGAGSDYFPYRYTFSDGSIGCTGGAVYAVDLLTGYTLWEWAQPYMLFDDECFTGHCFGEGSPQGLIMSGEFDCATYEQFGFDMGQCEQAFDGSAMLGPAEPSHLVRPPKFEDGLMWEARRGTMIGPATINGELVFIPTMSGEVYVHSVLDGEHITTLFCPTYEHVDVNEKNETVYTPNREGTRSGQTMFDDYLIFYCGATCMSFATVQHTSLIVANVFLRCPPVFGGVGRWRGARNTRGDEAE